MLQGAEVYEEYAGDAEESGDDELARFFREIQEEEKRRSERAKKLLARPPQGLSKQGRSRAERAACLNPAP